MPSDAELLTAFTDVKTPESARQQAFRTLVERHGALVLSACRSVLRSAADAEDAFQATFFVLARKAGSIERGAGLAAWLHRVALRISWRAARRRSTQKMESLSAADEPAAAELQRVTTQASLTAVHEAIAALSPALRSVVLVTYFQGLSRREAAEQLGITPAAVQARLKKARGELRRRLALGGVSLGMVLLVGGSATAAPTLVSLSQATVETVWGVQSGLAAVASSATPTVGAVSSIALAQGVLRAMTISTILRHAVLILFAVGSAWLAFGPIGSPTGGGAVGAITLAPGEAISAEPQAALEFVALANPAPSGGGFQDQQKQDDDLRKGENSFRKAVQDAIEKSKLPALSDEQLKSLNWGEEVAGLQAAVRVKGETADSYALGSVLDIEFVLRNVSDKPIELESSVWREDDSMSMTITETGKDIGVVSKNWYSGWPVTRRYELKPGEHVRIACGSLGIAGMGILTESFKHPVVFVPELKPGKYAARFKLQMPDIRREGYEGWKGELTTGDLELNVTPKPFDGGR